VWVQELKQAADSRNDVMHALPVLHGLHGLQRRKEDPSSVVNFFEPEDLQRVRELMERVILEGNRLLYQDGGERVRAYTGG